MNRIVVSSTFVLVALAAVSGAAQAQRRTSIGFAAGATFPVEGEDVRLLWDPAAPRVPRLGAGVLRVGGPEAGLSRRIELFLRRRALDVMSKEVA